jgi:hypothetical protein
MIGPGANLFNNEKIPSHKKKIRICAQKIAAQKITTTRHAATTTTNK